MIWFLSYPHSPVSKLDRRHTGRLRKRDNLQTEGRWGGGEGSGRGAESYDCKKSWSSINHSIMSYMKLSRQCNGGKGGGGGLEEGGLLTR
jgi:hypothetical protein